MRLTGSKVFLRFLEQEDAEPLRALRERNAGFFQRYSPTHDSSYCSLERARSLIEDSRRDREEGRDYYFGIFLNESEELIGTVNLFHVLRGPLQKCMIGYSLDRRHNGHGYATEAVSMAVRFSFDELKLHRVEAGVMPENVASMRVLEKVGFQKEGIERKGVKINGRWEDHQIFSVLSDRED